MQRLLGLPPFHLVLLKPLAHLLWSLHLLYHHHFQSVLYQLSRVPLQWLLWESHVHLRRHPFQVQQLVAQQCVLVEQLVELAQLEKYDFVEVLRLYLPILLHRSWGLFPYLLWHKQSSLIVVQRFTGHAFLVFAFRVSRHRPFRSGVAEFGTVEQNRILTGLLLVWRLCNLISSLLRIKWGFKLFLCLYASFLGRCIPFGPVDEAFTLRLILLNLGLLLLFTEWLLILLLVLHAILIITVLLPFRHFAPFVPILTPPLLSWCYLFF